MGAPAGTERPKPPLGHIALRWILVGVAVLTLTLGTNLFRPTLRGLKLASQIVAGSAAFNAQIRNNEALEKQIAFLKTEQGKRWAARRYGGLVEPGQTVGQVVEKPAPAEAGKQKSRPVAAWLNQQGVCGAACLHQAGQVLRCYAGLRPPDQPPKKSNQKLESLSKQGSGGEAAVKKGAKAGSS